MKYIKKYNDGWAIHDDETDQSRLLTKEEMETAKKEFPDLKDGKVLTVFADRIKSVQL